MLDNIILVLNWTVNLINQIWPIALATFFGAWSAFRLQRYHEKKKETAAQLSAGKQAQFAIVTKLNALKNVKKNYLDAQRENRDRATTLTPFTVHGQFPRLDLGALKFMLEGDGATLLNDRMVSEHRFLMFLGILEQRNRRHERMQLQIAGGAIVDAATAQILTDMTDHLYGVTDDAIESHTAGFAELKKYLETRFPKEKALGMEFKY